MVTSSPYPTHVPLMRMHQAALHPWGIAVGLQVTQTAPSELTIAEGLAIDVEGRMLTVAAEGQTPGESGQVFVHNTSPGSLVEVPAVVSTQDLAAGSYYVTLAVAITVGPDGEVEGRYLFDEDRIVSTPLIQLQPQASLPPDDTAIILATVVVSEDGAMSLSRTGRQLARLAAGEVVVRRSTLGTPAPESVGEMVSGRIGALSGGGLQVTVPQASDRVLMARDDTTAFGDLTVRAQHVRVTDGADQAVLAVDTEQKALSIDAELSSLGGPLRLAGGQGGEGVTEGDVRIGTSTHRLTIGVLTEGVEAGEVRLRAQGGMQRLILGSDTTDVLSIQNNQVGIGTLSPEHTLQLGDTSASVSLSLRGPAEASMSSVFAFEEVEGTTARGFQWVHDTASRLLKIVSSEIDPIMTFDRMQGRVGIGTLTPGAGLDVARNTLLIRDRAGASPQVRVESQSTLQPALGPPIAGGESQFILSDANGRDEIVLRSGRSGAGGQGSLHIGQEGVERVRLDSNGDSYFNGGNLGIGTTNLELAKLVISSSGYPQIAVETAEAGGVRWQFGGGSGAFAIRDADKSAYRFWIENTNGHVGIGTTTPTAALHVVSNSRGIHSVVQGADAPGSIAGRSAVSGFASSDSRLGMTGVRGFARSPGTNVGVSGQAVRGRVNHGIVGRASGGETNFAGVFHGDVRINGSLSKSRGGFLIDHPLDPLNKLLRHNFVESPENLCLYRGKLLLDANGTGEVTMPDYFAALTKEESATVTLSAIGTTPFPISYAWNERHTGFSIFGVAHAEVSYLVLADRDDPVIRRLTQPVEEEKGTGECERGQLLSPEAYGYPPEMGVSAEIETGIEEHIDLPAPGDNQES